MRRLNKYFVTMAFSVSSAGPAHIRLSNTNLLTLESRMNWDERLFSEDFLEARDSANERPEMKVDVRIQAMPEQRTKEPTLAEWVFRFLDQRVA